MAKVEPIGWNSMKGSLHLKAVFPEESEIGMYANLHRNMTKRFLPKEVVTRNQYNVDLARRILHRQRVSIRFFSGSRLNARGSTSQQPSARLHRSTLVRENTAPAMDFQREMSDIYSNFRSDASILTDASISGQQFPPLKSAGRHQATLATIPSSSAISRGGIASPDKRGVVDRLTAQDPEKVPDSKGYVVRLQRTIVYKKKYTEDEIQGIVRRLSEYNPQTCPAESKGVRETISCVNTVPRQSMIPIKKCSSAEVQDIVQRLYTFDSEKWPPESKPRIMRSARTAKTMTSGPL